LAFHQRLLDAAGSAVSAEGERELSGDADDEIAGAPPDRAAPLRPDPITASQWTTPMEQWQASWRRTDYRRRLDASIRAPRLHQCVTIGILSPEGRVGRTTIAALLGSLLSYTRHLRVVAIDASPDYGARGSALAGDHEVFADDVLDIVDQREVTAAELDAKLGRGPDGLMVLPAPTEPRRVERLDQRAYMRLIERLETKVGAILLDCGADVQEPAAQAATLAADQLILVSDPEPSTGMLVAQEAKLLERRQPLHLVINKLPRRRAALDPEALGALVPAASGMTAVERNPTAAERLAAHTFTWAEPAGPWAVSVRELACTIAAQWGGLGLTTPAAAGA